MTTDAVWSGGQLRRLLGLSALMLSGPAHLAVLTKGLRQSAPELDCTEPASAPDEIAGRR